MRAFFLGILCLAAFRAPAAETLSGLCRFGAEELQAGTALRYMERESGKWLPRYIVLARRKNSQYGFYEIFIQEFSIGYYPDDC